MRYSALAQLSGGCRFAAAVRPGSAMAATILLFYLAIKRLPLLVAIALQLLVPLLCQSWARADRPICSEQLSVVLESGPLLIPCRRPDRWTLWASCSPWAQQRVGLPTSCSERSRRVFRKRGSCSFGDHRRSAHRASWLSECWHRRTRGSTRCRYAPARGSVFSMNSRPAQPRGLKQLMRLRKPAWHHSAA
jgi:hypothetical protein